MKKAGTTYIDIKRLSQPLEDDPSKSAGIPKKRVKKGTITSDEIPDSSGNEDYSIGSETARRREKRGK